MTKEMQALVERISADENLQKQFKGCTSREEQVVLAKRLGFEISVAELQEAGKLSDDDLDQVAGGTCYVHVSSIC